MGGSMMTPPLEPSSPLDGGIRKRVCKACDRCRLKKSKCDGASPCSRCKADNAICVFGERKKSHDKIYPKGYVEMLEAQQAQLVSGLQELYKRTQKGQGWTGNPLMESSQGTPLTHEILDRLGCLKQEGHSTSEGFEEDLNALQSRLIAQGASMMERQPSNDDSSDSAPSPRYDAHSKPRFSNPFSTNAYPATPPNQSPYPSTIRTIPQMKSQTYPQVTAQSNLTWSTPISDFDEGMDVINQYDSPMLDSAMDGISFPPHMFQEQLALTAINPMFMMKDWSEHEQYQRYVDPSMI